MISRMKICTKCKIEKEFGCFHKDSGQTDGHYTICKDCRKEKSLDYYWSNRESILAKTKKYNRQPERIEAKRLYDQDYYSKNRNKKINRESERAKNNPEKARQYSKISKQRNKHKVAADVRARQAAKINRTPIWLTEEQKNQIEDLYWLARDLRRVTGETYHVDHIVPLQGENVSGLHVPWNLQVLPSYINESKGNKYEWE